MTERPAPSTKPVLQKLLLKADSSALVLNAPDSYTALWNDAPSGVRVSNTFGEQFDFIHYFATHRDQLLRDGPHLRDAMKPGGVLWISYPKGKKVATDLNRDSVANTLKDVRMEAFFQVAIDDVWSALRARPI